MTATVTALNRRARLEARAKDLDAENTKLYQELSASVQRESSWRLLAACLLVKLGGSAEVPGSSQRMLAECIPSLARLNDAGDIRVELASRAAVGTVAPAGARPASPDGAEPAGPVPDGPTDTPAGQPAEQGG